MTPLDRVQEIIADWQAHLPACTLVLGGSLVSGLFVQDASTRAYDVDLRFLTDDPLSDPLREQIEQVTGLRYKKPLIVDDWPTGQSQAVMVEGEIDAGLDLPLEIEGCIRNRKYVGWARFYPVVLSQEELDAFKQQKMALKENKPAYKAMKKAMLHEVQQRCITQKLVSLSLEGE
jgi:hypothetical protein